MLLKKGRARSDSVRPCHPAPVKETRTVLRTSEAAEFSTTSVVCADAVLALLGANPFLAR
jgi:hypothetical protein